jgi:AraC-like DNA-binding protein
MRVTIFAPSERLAPFVRQYNVVETDVEVTRALLPEQGLMLGIRFRGSACVLDGETATRVAGNTLTGIVGAARRMRTAARSGAVFAAFRETGAARFFAEPLHELFGRTLALEDLISRTELQRVQQRIAAAPDHARRVAILEQFLLERIRPDAADSLVDAATSAIRRARGSLRIAQLARELGISQDPLEKRFRRTVGTSPKQLASLVRLRHVIDAQRAGASWSRLAISAGYADQSHFIREFRAVTGAPPARFFQSGDYCAADPAAALATTQIVRGTR